MPARSPRVVLITGASSGIGAAVAREAARLGHHLVLTARRLERLEQLANELRAHPVETLIVPADLADPASPERLVAATVDRFGGLDVLINNAGLGLPQLFAQAEPEAIAEQIQVNLAAPILLTRYALPSLLERRGTVINIGSGITAVANPALGAYGVTKAGLSYFNDALRREVRHRGVRVSLVEPGPVTTEFFEAMGIPARQVPGIYNPLRDPPPAAMCASAEEVARRIVRLIERPRRRVSVLRRVIWPHRLVGVLFQLAPWLGDLAVTSVVQHLERTTNAGGMPHAPRKAQDAPSSR
ncbi:MAG TPA: SDR family NAD(P)-dependent oxidoreductase [Isosphaeraceae bacterium]|jgi:hypothetical protein|nr:SDR family NAD(P)-dependent oxidoreductase [Isosphaeraceae bacterium]